jgi:hypothetical protein
VPLPAASLSDGHAGPAVFAFIAETLREISAAVS